MQQQKYHDRPLSSRVPGWHEVPTHRYSRHDATYRARPVLAQQDLLTRSFPTLLLVLAAVFVLLAGFVTMANGACSAVEPAVAEEEVVEPVKSTARDQWVQGKVPYLYQIDAEWSATPYAGGTVADSGCGPTCMSMVYVALTGKKDKDPAQMAVFSERNGYIDCGMTSWMFMTDGARRLGLVGRDLPADESVIRQELAAGHPIIVSVSEGDFTTKGHFIVMVGTDAFGRIIIRDPNSPERSAQAWDLSRILSQTRNLWAFTR